MQQYFIEGIHNVGDYISFNIEQCHHILHVLRMKSNAQVRIVDEENKVFISEIDIQNKVVFAKLIQLLPMPKKRGKLILAAALIKGDRWDFLIQKACELGVDEVIPIVSKRCVVKVKEDALEKKISRWNKIALEACEQCKRESKVIVNEPMLITDLITQEASLKIVAYENLQGSSNTLKSLLMQQNEPEKIIGVIGPEGGFEEQEIEMLMQHNFYAVSLGKRILRAETAAITMVANISFFYDF